MDIEKSLIAESRLFSNEAILSPEELNQQLYERVSEFYGLEYTALYNQEITKEKKAERHLKVAQNIGDLMDQQFINHLKQREDFRDIGRVVDILPLRGALALVPDNNRLVGLNPFGKVENYEMIPIGVKRDGPEAHIYFPSEFTLEGRLTGDSRRTIYRIKDFGIATGGTAIELIKKINELTSQGVSQDQIVIQGAVGTFMAQERIMKEFPGVKVLFAVEGEMPIESNPKVQMQYPGQQKNYLELIAENSYLYYQAAAERMVLHDVPEEVAYAQAKIDPGMFYLNKIKQVKKVAFENIAPIEGGDVPPKDWGDESSTEMDDEVSIIAFVNRLAKILNDNFQSLDHKAVHELVQYYGETLLKKKGIRQ